MRSTAAQDTPSSPTSPIIAIAMRWQASFCAASDSASSSSISSSESSSDGLFSSCCLRGLACHCCMSGWACSAMVPAYLGPGFLAVVRPYLLPLLHAWRYLRQVLQFSNCGYRSYKKKGGREIPKKKIELTTVRHHNGDIRSPYIWPSGTRSCRRRFSGSSP